MKKLLLGASLALVSMSAMAADVTVDGITLTPMWETSLTKGNYESSDLPFVKNGDYDRARTMCVKDGKLIIGYSHKIEVNGELNSGSAHIIIVDQATGKVEKTVQCTLDGNTIDDLLITNSVGVDDFGNVWFTAYRQNFQLNDGTMRPVNFYRVKNVETGECELAFTLYDGDDDGELGARTDFYSLVGDVTGQQAGTVVMTAGCENSTSACVFGWRRDQGSTKFEPHMCDGGYYSQALQETYPAEQTTLNYGSMLYICQEEEGDYSGSLYVVDGFTTFPALYDNEGNMIDGLASLDDTNADCLPGDAACNGFIEFKLGENNLCAYPLAEHGKAYNDIKNIAGIFKYGPDKSFAGIKKLFNIPEAGLGETGDGGIRIHSFALTKLPADANGKEAVMLSQFRCRNGIATYRVAEEGYQGAGVGSIVADQDSNAPVEYFNLQGVRVANPQAGQLVIRRQGDKASKEYIR